VPEQIVVQRDAHANEPFAVIDQQPYVELDAGQFGDRQALQTFTQRGPRDGDGIDEFGLAAMRPLRRSPAVSRAATRTTRSPRTSKNRSNAPETCRQSSSAHTRSSPSWRAHCSTAAKPRAPTSTMFQPSTSV
jgi:hypothetical protein